MQQQATMDVKARSDVIVLGTNRTVGVDAYLGDEDEAQTIQLALTSYRFCLNTPQQHYPSRVTLGAFADQIEANVDCEENPQNRAVVRTLRRVHARMVEAASCGVLLRIARPTTH